MLIALNYTVTDVQQRLGHRKPDTTLRVYVHQWRTQQAKQSTIGIQVGPLLNSLPTAVANHSHSRPDNQAKTSSCDHRRCERALSQRVVNRSNDRTSSLIAHPPVSRRILNVQAPQRTKREDETNGTRPTPSGNQDNRCSASVGRRAHLPRVRQDLQSRRLTRCAPQPRPRHRRRRRARAAQTTTAIRSRDGAGTSVDRDALLQQLFPNGLPARESVIRAANDWLDQAEQLAGMR
jgi:hypothetical protein